MKNKKLAKLLKTIFFILLPFLLFFCSMIVAGVVINITGVAAWYQSVHIETKALVRQSEVMLMNVITLSLIFLFNLIFSILSVLIVKNRKYGFYVLALHLTTGATIIFFLGWLSDSF
ncbi:MAG: hypothetical protein O3B47_04730 [bacterium]|nr:hypothetical protein [bacterium]